jgi:RHH-type rel operon transcriptional repressor/antitoxin RelB
MSTAISVRLPDDLARQLEGIAGETDRSKSYIIQKAVESYLQDRADFQVALDRLHDAGDAQISAKQMRRRLGL